ncbi:glycerol-3-phosphate dehydrogenase [Xenococcus sp. PCC 7305]|uniref:NAD(P)H-dependent glycerol-3-phosphate dehydrogenase n=1 Tax=Xenococcus sp. PCC 7305 TaxID=102125 RepID=UPI0002AC78FA|nr:NAD(P)H-dependent glycerol-3-phosphate dehydrogenase [Xenococcus sp. PCC 7305]ELS01977.1 glycerol-3-phosphate dehydrogenase [Xenococcus sp. PCC 7305]
MNLNLQTEQPASLTIIGAGAWGSALVNLAQKAGSRAQLWSRRSFQSLKSVTQDAEVILCATSMKGVNSTIAQLQKISIPETTILVSATKGLDAITMQTPSRLWQTAFPQNPVAVLSGPNLSPEIVQGLPATTAIASTVQAAAEKVQKMFSSDLFRVYVNDDPIGTELGGTLKNVIAIAVGVSDGLQLGTNAKSALITRSLKEIIAVGTHLGGKRETFWGLAGLGDLLATCSSSLSRNYRVGYELAQGKSLATVLDELQGTAEGVNTAHVLLKLAKTQNIQVPICQQVCLLLNDETTPKEALDALMNRELKSEFIK